MSQKQPGYEFVSSQIRNQGGVGVYRVDTKLHRLQWNENPFDFPADLKEAVLQRLAKVSWSNYPTGPRAFDVIDAVAKATDLGSNQVIVGNGSSDILRIVISAFLQLGDHLVTLSPTFGSYANHARQAGADVQMIHLESDNNFALPVDLILEEANRCHAKMIVICAPNNPTGTVFPMIQLQRIVEESECIVFVDAAYAEFCNLDFRPLLQLSDRVVIAHTLSKAYSLAGVRIGYALSSPEIATELQKLVINFTMSPFTESAAIIALENRERFQPLIAAVVAERERLQAELGMMPGITVYPSGTNFLFVDVGRLGKEVQHYLRTEQGVLVSDMGMYPGYENYLRISVGTPQQNDLVVEGMARYLTAVGA